VVYPPVDTDFYCPDATIPTRAALVVSALAPYKRIDLAIEGCRRAGVALRIVGTGPEEGRLRAMAGPDVEFLGRCSDETVRDGYRRAGVVLLTGEEDFGIVPVEAQACGRPVVALGRGGALETVIDGVTGVLVPSDSPEAFAGGIRRALDAPFDRAAIRRHAESFGRGRFLETFRTAIEETMSAPAGEAAW
jgi:glycosyltransferase involved in cell wall biosynthesis